MSKRSGNATSRARRDRRQRVINQWSRLAHETPDHRSGRCPHSLSRLIARRVGTRLPCWSGDKDALVAQCGLVGLLVGRACSLRVGTTLPNRRQAADVGAGVVLGRCSSSGGESKLAFAAEPSVAVDSSGGVSRRVPNTTDPNCASRRVEDRCRLPFARTDEPRIIDAHSSGGGATVRYPTNCSLHSRSRVIGVADGVSVTAGHASCHLWGVGVPPPRRTP